MINGFKRLSAKIINYTLASLPAAIEAIGVTARITDLGTGSALFYSNGNQWLPCGEQLIYVDNVGATLTGTTNETVLSTFSFPKKLASPNMTIVINSLWAMSSSASTKTPRVRLGGISGTEYMNPTITTSTSFQSETNIRLRNAVNSQVGFASAPTSPYGVSGASGVTSTLDMSAADRDIVLTGQLQLGTDNLTLRAYNIILRG